MMLDDGYRLLTHNQVMDNKLIKLSLWVAWNGIPPLHLSVQANHVDTRSLLICCVCVKPTGHQGWSVVGQQPLLMNQCPVSLIIDHSWLLWNIIHQSSKTSWVSHGIRCSRLHRRIVNHGHQLSSIIIGHWESCSTMTATSCVDSSWCPCTSLPLPKQVHPWKE